ncbi:hypothetical protein SeMB42_g07151 [Synchytrium endobioticum]|uniref:Uncharacterized protein n=1 Tax=Synchytrium endobioticum TaxID=286115 RepID=A0A507C8H3_9FUNG|nr:hypothetical protein SeMB42_g07151 [Synchytrium endobioticum]
MLRTGQKSKDYLGGVKNREKLTYGLMPESGDWVHDAMSFYRQGFGNWRKEDSPNPPSKTHCAKSQTPDQRENAMPILVIESQHEEMRSLPCIA